MTRRNRARSSSLFLMELIIAIFFFSAASAVCIQFFVKSHLLSQESNALNHAVNECTSTAELIDASDSVEDSLNMLMRLYPNGSYPNAYLSSTETEVQEADVQIYYDDSFKECISQDSSYMLALHISKDGTNDGLLLADMQVISTEDSNAAAVIYELSTKHHVARRTDYEER